MPTVHYLGSTVSAPNSCCMNSTRNAYRPSQCSSVLSQANYTDADIKFLLPLRYLLEY